MANYARWFAVGVWVLLQGVAGLFLSVFALLLVKVIPSLTQAPPNLHHNLNDSASHSPRRRELYSLHTLSSDESSGGPSEPPSPTRELHIRQLSADNPPVAAIFDAHLLRARSIRPVSRPPRTLLPTLEEDPIPRSSSTGDFAPMGPLSYDSETLYESPTGTPEEELSLEQGSLGGYMHESGGESEEEDDAEGEDEGKASTPGRKKKHRLRLPYFNRSLSQHGKPKLCRCRSLPEAINSLAHRRGALRGSTWASTTEHTRRRPRPPPLDFIPREETFSKWKTLGLQSHKAKGTSRAPAPRTHPYEAPYFFPSPVSPDAYDYVHRVRMDLQHPDRFPGAPTQKASSGVTFVPERRASTD
ncbi:hypothetical protein FA95DRAFT_1601052 [Auriscalpium vulgare]|uniref:Uncharacterized protein n=1 Tax=Auriscalpium vulgare TaxID=40419 RepID=A0ACB8SC57_9AGAM|nr:hypothetical protein FA95DRAFT_1601052 [Auriscalpium vulgare]